MQLALQICKIKVALEYAIIDLKPPNVSKKYTVVKDMTVAVLSLINQAAASTLVQMCKVKGKKNEKKNQPKKIQEHLRQSSDQSVF